MNPIERPLRLKRSPITLVSWFLPPLLTGSAVVSGRLAVLLQERGVILFGPRRGIVDSHESLEKRSDSAFRGIVGFPVLLARMVWTVVHNRSVAVIGVFPNGYYLIASALVSFLLGVPFFPYLHNTFSENRSGWRSVVAETLIDVIFAFSKTVFLMSDGLLEYYRNQHPFVKMQPLPHVLSDLQKARSSVAEANIERGIITLVGAVNESNADATHCVLDAFQGVEAVTIRMLTSTPDQELRHYGIFPSATVEIIRDPSDASFLNRIAHSEVVVLTHGLSGGMSEVEYQTIFPTRTLDLLVSGRPILALCPHDSLIARFLTQHACAKVVTTGDSSCLLSAYFQLIENQQAQAKMILNSRNSVSLFHPNQIRQRVLTCICGDEGRLEV